MTAQAWWAELTDVQREGVRLLHEALPAAPADGETLAQILASNIRRLTDADPRTNQAIAAVAWPELEANAAKMQIQRMRVGRDGRPIWPGAGAICDIARALGVQPFVLLVPAAGLD